MSAAIASMIRLADRKDGTILAVAATKDLHYFKAIVEINPILIPSSEIAKFVVWTFNDRDTAFHNGDYFIARTKEEIPNVRAAAFAKFAEYAKDKNATGELPEHPYPNGTRVAVNFDGITPRTPANFWDKPDDMVGTAIVLGYNAPQRIYVLAAVTGMFDSHRASDGVLVANECEVKAIW